MDGQNPNANVTTPTPATIAALRQRPTGNAQTGAPPPNPQNFQQPFVTQHQPQQQLIIVDVVDEATIYNRRAFMAAAVVFAAAYASGNHLARFAAALFGLGVLGYFTYNTCRVFSPTHQS